jgi:hypothetical protein
MGLFEQWWWRFASHSAGTNIGSMQLSLYTENAQDSSFPFSLDLTKLIWFSHSYAN